MKLLIKGVIIVLIGGGICAGWLWWRKPSVHFIQEEFPLERFVKP